MSEVRLTKEEVQSHLSLACAKWGSEIAFNYVGFSELICNAQLTKLFKWGNEPCPHFEEVNENCNTLRTQPKHECDLCWQYLITPLNEAREEK